MFNTKIENSWKNCKKHTRSSYPVITKDISLEFFHCQNWTTTGQIDEQNTHSFSDHRPRQEPVTKPLTVDEIKIYLHCRVTLWDLAKQIRVFATNRRGTKNHAATLNKVNIFEFPKHTAVKQLSNRRKQCKCTIYSHSLNKRRLVFEQWLDTIEYQDTHSNNRTTTLTRRRDATRTLKKAEMDFFVEWVDRRSMRKQQYPKAENEPKHRPIYQTQNTVTPKKTSSHRERLHKNMMKCNCGIQLAELLKSPQPRALHGDKTFLKSQES